MSTPSFAGILAENLARFNALLCEGGATEIILTEDQAISALDKITLDCPHERVTILRAVAAGLDDHSTSDVRCLDCASFLVITTWSTQREPEIGPMDPARIAQYNAERDRRAAQLEQSHRHSDWIADLQDAGGPPNDQPEAE